MWKMLIWGATITIIISNIIITSRSDIIPTSFSLPTFQIPFDTSLFPTSLNSSLSGSTSDCESEPPPPCPPWGWREEAACPPWGWRGDGQAGFACFLQVLRLSDERRLKIIHAASDHLYPSNKTLERPATWNKCLCLGIAPESWWSQ